MSLPIEGYAQAFDENDLIDVDDSNFSVDEVEWFNLINSRTKIGNLA